MKKIIVVLILLLISNIGYTEFLYKKGSFVYNNCKVKIISSSGLLGKGILEREINAFCNNKEILDIKFQDNEDTTVLIIYKEK